jgi:hypothetical protein
MRCLTRVVALSVMMASGGTSVAGGGATGGSTEFTQLMNNVELVKSAVDQAQTAATTVQQYATQVKQFNMQQLNIAGLTHLPTGLSEDNLRSLNDVLRYQQALQGLQGSLSTQSQIMQQRIAESRLGGTDTPTYLARVARDVQMGNGKAVERMRQEQSALQQVQSDYEYARSVQQQIPATVGQHQSVQLLNAQVNRVITQNARVIELMTTTVSRDRKNYDDEANTAAMTAAQQELLRQRQRAVEQRQRQWGGLQR